MRTIARSLVAAALLAASNSAAAQNGLDVTSSALGISVTTTGTDAIRILDSGDDGIQIGSNPSYPNYGVYIPSPGVSTYGLWPNTANASGQWALYTVDNIEAGNVAAASFHLLARLADSLELEPGEIVSAAGVGAHDEAYPATTVAVRRAAASAEGIVGVVHSRLDWVEPMGKEGEKALESAPGAAQPGDFVLLTVLGVQRVKIDAGLVIQQGQRLTVGEREGRARPLRTRRVDGLTLTEGTPAVGIALEATSGVEDSVLVFVSLR